MNKKGRVQNGTGKAHAYPYTQNVTTELLQLGVVHIIRDACCLFFTPSCLFDSVTFGVTPYAKLCDARRMSSLVAIIVMTFSCINLPFRRSKEDWC